MMKILIILIVLIFLVLLIIQSYKYIAIRKTAYIDKLTGVYNRYMWFLSRGYIDWKKFKNDSKKRKESLRKEKR